MASVGNIFACRPKRLLYDVVTFYGNKDLFGHPTESLRRPGDVSDTLWNASARFTYVPEAGASSLFRSPVS